MIKSYRYIKKHSTNKTTMCSSEHTLAPKMDREIFMEALLGSCRWYIGMPNPREGRLMVTSPHRKCFAKFPTRICVKIGQFPYLPLQVGWPPFMLCLLSGCRPVRDLNKYGASTSPLCVGLCLAFVTPVLPFNQSLLVAETGFYVMVQLCRL